MISMQNLKVKRYIVYGMTACLSWLFLTAIFIYRYGASFRGIPFHDDFPETYCMSVKGVEMLFNGGIFGWDSRHLGGYPAAYTGTTSIAFLFLPFYFLGQYGYQLMHFCLWLSFPVLVSVYAYSLFGDRKITAFALLYSTMAFPLYLDLFLHWGNIHNLAGINVFVLCLIFNERMKQKKAMSFFISVFLLILLYYTVITHALVFSVFLIIDWLCRPSKPLLKRTALLMALVFFGTLNYTWYYIKYGGYWRGDFMNYTPVFKILDTRHLWQSLPELLRYVTSDTCRWLWSAPLLLLAVRKNKLRPIVIMINLALLIFIIAKLSIATDFNIRFFPRKIANFLPVVTSIVFAFWTATLKSRALKALPLLILLALLYPNIQSKWQGKIPVISGARRYNPALFENIKKLDGNLILFENTRGNNNLLINKEDPRWSQLYEHTHIAQLMAMETDKKFFSTTHEGWHETAFRGNAIIGGVYKGRLLPDVPVEEIENTLALWGIKYLVLRTGISKDYFRGFPERFEKVWEGGEWEILRYLAADAREVSMRQGKGEIIHEGYFDKKIRLLNALKGDTISVRTNYFPSWKAYCNGKRLPISDVNGQIGWTAPLDGNYIVTLKFPGYAMFSLLALFSLAVSWFLSFKKYLP